MTSAWFKELCAARGFAPHGGKSGRFSRIFSRDGQVMKVQYLIQQPYEGPQWLAVQLFGYTEEDGEAPDPRTLAMLIRGEALL